MSTTWLFVFASSTQPTDVLMKAASKVWLGPGIDPVVFSVAPPFVAIMTVAALAGGVSPTKTASFGSTTLNAPGYDPGPYGTPGAACCIVICSSITARQDWPLTVA